MISEYDVIRQFRRAEKEGEDLSLKLSEDEKSLVDSTTREYVCSVRTFTEELRKKEHCDFESIYYEHATLTDVYRCRQCGTVIFGGDDEYHYNPNEKCPTCCNDPSVCHNEYWTKEQIDSDPEKQKTIQFLIDEQARKNREYERSKKRNGLYDWQRWQKKFKTKKHGYEITYICFGYDGDLGKVPKGRKADRYLEIDRWNLDDYIMNHRVQIPLNWHNIYCRWIYPYSKKCPESIRKYAFWQKKPAT